MMLLTKVRLFISNSKVLAKGSILLKIILFLFFFIVFEAMIGSLLEPPERSYNDFDPRIRWKEFYNQKNIDIVFLGSSHAYRSFDPENFDMKLKCNTFNLGSSNQSAIESYFALKETLRCYKPKLIVLENYWVLYEKYESFNAATCIYDYLKNSPVKFDMLINAFTPDQYLKAIFLSVRYHNNYKDIQIIKENVANKIVDKDQLTTKKSKTEEVYKAKGYVANKNVATFKQLNEENFFKNNAPGEWDEKRFLYLNKIIKLCKEKNVPLVLITAPLPPTTMKIVKNYDIIHKKFNDIANQYNIDYIDYNLINRDLEFLSDKDFKDDHHLNVEGANIMNQHLVNILRDVLQKKK